MNISDYFHPHPLGTNELWTINAATFISYNAHPCADMGILRSDTGGAETALILDGKFYILNGDFREAYIKAYEQGGVDACIALYAKECEEHGSSWSTGSDFFTRLDRRAKQLKEEGCDS